MTDRSMFGLVDYFIPGALRSDVATLWRLRIFVLSHLLGPAMGLMVLLYLYRADPVHDVHFWLIVTLPFLFFLLPPALKLFGRPQLMAFLSVVDLTVVSLYGSFFYGGVSSPHMVWALVALLLGFFYLGERKLLLLAIFGTATTAFIAAYVIAGGFPQRLSPQGFAGVGIVSVCCATVYTAMMAVYYANVLSQQSHLEQEARRHLALTLQLRRAKEEAERADHNKSVFLAKMSHQLRTPLNAVIGYSEILMEDAEQANDGQQVSDLRRINRAGQHLLSLVTDVLDLDKLERENFDIAVERFDLASFIDDVAETCRSLVLNNGNQFDVEYGDGLGTVVADPRRLRQVILNLLSNSAKFTRRGRVVLSAARLTVDGRDCMRICVRDNGIGIRAENLASLFRDFNQGDASTHSRFGGTGLGLAVSRSLCRMMHGDVTVDSEEGKGSAFTITLPADAAPAAAAGDAADAAPGAAPVEEQAAHGPRLAEAAD